MSNKKMHYFKKLLLVLPLVATLSSCDPSTQLDRGTLELNYRTRVSGQTFEPGIIYNDLSGRKYMIENFKFLTVGLQATNKDGTTTFIDDSHLYRIAGNERMLHGEGVYQSFAIDPGNYKGLFWDMGASATNNFLPLSESKGSGLQDASMFISTDLGRKFIVLKGKVDTSQVAGSTAWKDFSYTVADTLLRRRMEMDTLAKHAFSIAGKQETQFIVEIDLNEVLRGVWTDTLLLGDISLPYTKNGRTLATKMADNMVNKAMYRVDE